MADLERENPLGFVDKRRTQATATSALGTPANYGSTSSLRTRLAAINGALYTSAFMNTMTRNDMVYAVRLADDPTGI